MSEIIDALELKRLQDIDIENEYSDLLSERNELLKFVNRVNKFLKIQTVDIFKVCVVEIAKEIKELGEQDPSLMFLGDDYNHLDLYEQMSLYGDEMNMYDNFELMFLIQKSCEQKIESLNESELFLVSNRYTDIDEEQYCPISELTSLVIQDIVNYQSEKLSEYR